MRNSNKFHNKIGKTADRVELEMWELHCRHIVHRCIGDLQNIEKIKNKREGKTFLGHLKIFIVIVIIKLNIIRHENKCF